MFKLLKEMSTIFSTPLSTFTVGHTFLALPFGFRKEGTHPKLGGPNQQTQLPYSKASLRQLLRLFENDVEFF